MNICGFSRVNYWQGIKGGMDLHGKLLSEGMVKRGHNVSIISTRHLDGKEHEERNGVNIYYLKDTVFGSRRKGWRQESVLKFFNLHNKKPFDVIWSQSFDAFGLINMKKTSLNMPVICTLHGSIQQEFKTFITNISNNLKKPVKIIESVAGLFYSYFVVQRSLLSFSDRVITVSSKVREDIKKWYGREIADKCVIVPNGIDVSLFKPDLEQRKSTRQAYGIDERETVLLTLGRLTHEKGHHLAIDALRQLKTQNMKVRLLIVGTGNYHKSLMEKVKKAALDNEVIFVGFVENRDTVKYYNSADIFLMPTLTVEGLPFVLLEAMSCGKPVIATYIGGITSAIMNGKNGLLIDAGKCSQITDKIQLLTKNPDLANSLAESAKRTVHETYSVDMMVDRTLQIMKTAVLNET